jgi:hypothetical protein
VKHSYKRRKLEEVAVGREVRHEALVRESLSSLRPDAVKRICKSVVIKQILKESPKPRHCY